MLYLKMFVVNSTPLNFFCYCCQQSITRLKKVVEVEGRTRLYCFSLIQFRQWNSRILRLVARYIASADICAMHKTSAKFNDVNHNVTATRHDKLSRRIRTQVCTLDKSFCPQSIPAVYLHANMHTRIQNIYVDVWKHSCVVSASSADR